MLVYGLTIVISMICVKVIHVDCYNVGLFDEGILPFISAHNSDKHELRAKIGRASCRERV